MLDRRQFVKIGAAVGAGMMLPLELADKAFAYNLLGHTAPANPRRLRKYVDALPIPGVMPEVSSGYYDVSAVPTTVRVHSQMSPTRFWSYRPTSGSQIGGVGKTYLGPSFVVPRGTPTRVRWQNKLVDDHGRPIPHPLPVDPSLHWAAPFGDNMLEGPFPVDATSGQSTFSYKLNVVPLAPHVHGGEQEPESDGGPDTWFTPNWGATGSAWTQKVYKYSNGQPRSTIWYHDHALGLTRLNVYMGLAGAYLITDSAAEPAGLPGAAYDIPLVIQDRVFDTKGQLYFPAAAVNPQDHPFWVPEFFGDTILVNGKVWPYLNVEPRAYRFRILNGSNARFYSLFLDNPATRRVAGPAFHQIATDGGYLHRPVTIPGPQARVPGRLLIAPGERAEVVIDFSDYAGKKLVLHNDASAPYPDGDIVTPSATTGQIMQFRVKAAKPKRYTFPRNPLNPSLAHFPSINPDDAVKTRVLTLNEVMGAGGPLEVLLNLSKYMAPVSEDPKLGTTEVWKIVNTTGDTHPMHVHLTQFQLVSRQPFDTAAYQAQFDAINGTMAFDGMMPNDSGNMAYQEVDPAPYLLGSATPADPNERGWKDTVRMNPGDVTTIVVRFAPVDGTAAYPFDATAEPGYVWHCHIVDHEDNEMMRPYKLQP